MIKQRSESNYLEKKKKRKNEFINASVTYVGTSITQVHYFSLLCLVCISCTIPDDHEERSECFK